MFQNGSSAASLVSMRHDNATLFIQTNDESLVGNQRTMIRGCDSLQRLYELNLYINISDNTAPDFAKTVQTEFDMWINGTINYKLPNLLADYVDTPVVYLNAMES